MPDPITEQPTQAPENANTDPAPVALSESGNPVGENTPAEEPAAPAPVLTHEPIPTPESIAVTETLPDVEPTLTHEPEPTGSPISVPDASPVTNPAIPSPESVNTDAPTERFETPVQPSAPLSSAPTLEAPTAAPQAPAAPQSGGIGGFFKNLLGRK